MPDRPGPSTCPAERPSRRPFVLVTGLSGAGRATALHVLEDLGYVAVDNLPLPLLGELMRSTIGSPQELATPLAFGVDTRTYGFDSKALVRSLQQLRQRPDLAARLLYLDCDTEILQRRYTESRRPHPLAPDRPVVDGKSTVNPDLPTGEIEAVAAEIEVLSVAKELPVPVFGEPDYPEDLRLQYRFLDLRRETLHASIMLRNEIIGSIRRRMRKWSPSGLRPSASAKPGSTVARFG